MNKCLLILFNGFYGQIANENKVIDWDDLLFLTGGIKDDRILNTGLIDFTP